MLLNSQTAELDSLRTSMIYSGLEVIAHNQNRKNADLRLYEIGKTYHKTDNGYVQKQHLTLFLTGADAEENWLEKGKKYSFYHLKSYVDNLLTRFGIHQHTSEALETSPFIFAAKLSTEGKELATFGQIDKTLLKAFDIKQDVFYADIDWDYLTERSAFTQIQFQYSRRGLIPAGRIGPHFAVANRRPMKAARQAPP